MTANTPAPMTGPMTDEQLLDAVARPTVEFLLSNSEQEPNTGCWLWTRSYTNGYYAILFRGRRNRVRVSRAILGIERESSVVARHTCDNPMCVNPDHLVAGNHSDNMQDASRRRRLVNARKTHCHRGHPLSGSNLIPGSKYRRCRECWRINGRAHRAQKAARIRAALATDGAR